MAVDSHVSVTRKSVSQNAAFEGSRLWHERFNVLLHSKCMGHHHVGETPLRDLKSNFLFISSLLQVFLGIFFKLEAVALYEGYQDKGGVDTGT